MAYKRKTSPILTEAQQRAANMEAIDPALDLGNGLTVAAYRAQIVAIQASLDAYNTLLAQADKAGNDFKAAERQLRTLSGRYLAAVGVKYGKDSNEYEMAGGTRTSEINYRPAKPAEG